MAGASPPEATLYSDDAQTIATFGPLVALHWKHAATVERAKRQHTLVLQAFRGNAVRAFVVLLDAAVAPPDEEAREILKRSMLTAPERTLGLAYVVDEQGFGGAVKRGVITGLSLVSGAPYPVRTFKEDAMAAVWLATLVRGRAEAIDEVEIGAFLRRARSHQPGPGPIS